MSVHAEVDGWLQGIEDRDQIQRQVDSSSHSIAHTVAITEVDLQSTNLGETMFAERLRERSEDIILTFNEHAINYLYIQNFRINIRTIHLLVRAPSPQYLSSSCLAEGDSGTAHSMFKTAGTLQTVLVMINFSFLPLPLSFFLVRLMSGRKLVSPYPLIFFCYVDLLVISTPFL